MLFSIENRELDNGGSVGNVRLKLRIFLATVFLVLSVRAALSRSTKEGVPVCDAKATAAFKQLPAPQFRCENGEQFCSTDKAMRWDEPECRNATRD